MTTRISIIGIDLPLYVSSRDSVGFIFVDAPHTLVHFLDGECRISYSGHHPLYIYEDMGMLFIYGCPSTQCGPLLAAWDPQKPTYSCSCDEAGYRCPAHIGIVSIGHPERP